MSKRPGMHVKQVNAGASRPISSRLQVALKPLGCAGSQVVLSGVLAGTRQASGATSAPTPVFRAGTGIPCLLLGNCPPATWLTLPDPAHHGLGLQRVRRLVLAVTPSAAFAGGVLLPTATTANHGLILARPLLAETTGASRSTGASQAACVKIRTARAEDAPGAASRSVRVGPAHPPAALSRAFVLVQAAPRAVLLRPADRVT